MKEWVKQFDQQLWTDKDLLKYCVAAWFVGAIIGTLFGLDWAVKPVVECLRPLVG
jgi:hypothetical protein